MLGILVGGGRMFVIVGEAEFEVREEMIEGVVGSIVGDGGSLTSRTPSSSKSVSVVIVDIPNTLLCCSPTMMKMKMKMKMVKNNNRQGSE